MSTWNKPRKHQTDVVINEEGATIHSLPATRRGGMEPSPELLKAIDDRRIEDLAWELLKEHVATNKGERSFARDAASILSHIVSIRKAIAPKKEEEEEDGLDDFINQKESS